MTHNELLALINDEIEVCEPECNQHQRVNAPWLALCAVVEMHKPIFYPDIKGIERCSSMCNVAGQYVNYPCPTIQAIEKELA